MCLAVPMRVLSLMGYTAICEAKGERRDVNLFWLADEGVAVGDYVLVHVGYAIQTISAADATATWDLLDEIGTALDRADA